MSDYVAQNHTPGFMRILAINIRKSFLRLGKYSELLYQNRYDNSELIYNDMHFIGITGGVGAGKQQFELP